MSTITTEITDRDGEIIAVEVGDFVVGGEGDGLDIGRVQRSHDGEWLVVWEQGACKTPLPRYGIEVYAHEDGARARLIQLHDQHVRQPK